MFKKRDNRLYLTYQMQLMMLKLSEKNKPTKNNKIINASINLSIFFHHL